MATVEVQCLSFTPAASSLLDSAQEVVEALRAKLPARRQVQFTAQRPLERLVNVSFTAKPRTMTAILSATEGELRTIALLLAGRQTSGSFDGEITIKGAKSDGVTKSVGFVSRVAKSLYIPGLTYEEMLTYAARLRVPSGDLGSSGSIAKRVEEVLDMLDLKRCRHRVIPERPSSRGEIGGELRRLVVAVELISLPKVLVLDDPARNLDPSVALHLFTRLKNLADNGYTILFTVPTASQQIYRLFNKVVLLSQGHSIYAGDALHIKEYFTSSALSYRFAEDRNPVEFLLDVSSGIERPRGQREALPPDSLQRLFEASSYCDDGPNYPNPTLSPAPVGSEVTYSLLPKSHVPMYGYRFDGFSVAVKQSLVITERALLVKFKEREVLKKTFFASTFLGLFIGYFAYNTGDLGEYCLSLVRFPYPETVNVSAILFLNSAFLMIQQVLNVHIICQKLRVFRDEQKAGVSPYAGFWVATLVSEATIAIFFALIFCTTVYFLAALGDAGSMPFYLGVQILNTCVGVGTTVMLAAIFNSEVVVRDIFLVFTFLMLFLAGYIFTLPTVRSDIKDISQINPLRWVFEALMVWKFENIYDGPTFLETYGFENFIKENVFEILANFIIFSCALFFLALIPGPNLLHREVRKSDRFSTASVDSEIMTEDRKSGGGAFIQNVPRKSSKRSLTPAAPVLFLKEPSITGKKSTITSQTSRTGTGHVETRGPTLLFRRITYRVRDKDSIFGHKDILHSVSGQFDWGKLGVIMGSVHSGKSTLLQVLGGVPVSQSTKLSGTVLLNDTPYDRTLQPWQRSAYVGNLDQHIRDVTTKEIVTYAMQLRCASAEEFPNIEENVKNALELLSLNEVQNVKSKDLSPGELKRLSIAEEIVHGPMLLLVDEPVTGLEPKDAAVVMNVFREMVNQDRTVIVTLHQPTADIFQLFDTLLLLSKGRVAYMGPVASSVRHFEDTPTLRFDASVYLNPADFLLDISACAIKNQMNSNIDAPTLELFFQTSPMCRDSYLTDSALVAAATSSSGSGAPSVKKYGDNTASTGSYLLNPILEREGLTSKDESVTTEGTRKKSVSFDAAASPDMDAAGDDTGLWSTLALGPKSMLEAMRLTDRDIVWMHCKVIMKRSFLALFKREKLLISAVLLHLFLAFNFYWIMGDSSADTNPVVGFFAVNGLVIIVANVQWGFFVYRNNEVFLKENSRGLYSCFMHWLFGSLPYLLFRGVLGVMYSLVVVHLLRLSNDGDQLEYFTGLNVILVLASATLGEALILIAPDIRTVYTIIPAVGFILFFFSGLIIKPSTLPDWTQAWIPSVSIIRWAMQGMTISEFQNSDLFPVFGNYSTYEALLTLFGWGGKTKGFCLSVVVYNMIIFRVFSFFALAVRAKAQVGKRGLLETSQEDRLY